MALMEVALREGDYDKVLRLGAEVNALDPSNVLAHKRMSAALYAKKDYPKALKSLRQAHKLESEPEAKRQLKSYIDALVSLVEREAEPAAPKPPKAEAPAAGPSPVEMQKLYEAGVDLYAQGRLSEAANMFQRILDMDPANNSARRALQRVQSEILQGGK